MLDSNKRDALGLVSSSCRQSILAPFIQGTMFVPHNLNGVPKMAIDAYLQIDGIKGESTDSAHQGWIEVTGISWGVHQPKSATASTGGGHTAERARTIGNFVLQAGRPFHAYPPANVRMREDYAEGED